MTKVDLVTHLANIVTVLNFHTALGTTGNKFLLAEYEAREKELHDLLKKEQE